MRVSKLFVMGRCLVAVAVASVVRDDATCFAARPPMSSQAVQRLCHSATRSPYSSPSAVAGYCYGGREPAAAKGESSASFTATAAPLPRSPVLSPRLQLYAHLWRRPCGMLNAACLTRRRHVKFTRISAKFSRFRGRIRVRKIPLIIKADRKFTVHRPLDKGRHLWALNFIQKKVNEINGSVMRQD